MFDLNEAVDRWSKDFAGSACGRTDRVDELRDHLFCEIEENVKQGLSEESAFLAATRRFGISEEMKNEFRKGRNISSILCESDHEFHWFEWSTKQIAIATGIYLILFAIMTFGLTFLLKQTEYERFFYLRFFMY